MLGPMVVRIVRDVDGIAHVRAADLAGAFRGQGHAATKDRLWQMEFDRRKALGRLAEIIGPAAASSDRHHRRLGLARFAASQHDGLHARTREMLAAYADGVNEALRGLDALPPELDLLDAPPPEPWEPWHSIAVFEVRHLWMGTAEIKLWRTALADTIGPEATARLWPTLDGVTIDAASAAARADAERADVLGDAARLFAELGGGDGGGGGSNNLVLAGTRTATGRPIMAGDPHRAVDVPNVYWQNHVTWPDGDVIGLSFPGVPGFPHFGHNTEVAWSITHGMADDQDLFVERLRRRAGGVEYRRGADWQEAEVRTEHIAVAGGPTETVECVTTGNGPVVAGDPTTGIGLVMRWTATAGPDTTYDCLLPQMTARSVDELDRALRDWIVPCNNVLLADTGGSIRYRFRGRLAIRGAANRWGVVDGTDHSSAWTGFVADDALRRVPDPDRGYLVTANNPIGDGPYVSHDWAHPARADRLDALLGAGDGWTAADVLGVLGDTHSVVAERLATRLVHVAAHTDVERAAADALISWDHRMDAASAAAAVYAATRSELVMLLADRLGSGDVGAVGDVGYTAAQRARALQLRVGFVVDDADVVPDDLVTDAFRRGVARLVDQLGDDVETWRWGELHRAGFHHPLALLRPDLAGRLTMPDAVPLGGDNECVWASGSIPPSLRATTGPVARYVMDVGDWDASGWIVPHGVHGDPRSPHFTDQLDDWADVGLRPMRFSAAVVDVATASVLDLD